jgi:hypothetical protein
MRSINVPATRCGAKATQEECDTIVCPPDTFGLRGGRDGNRHDKYIDPGLELKMIFREITGLIS